MTADLATLGRYGIRGADAEAILAAGTMAEAAAVLQALQARRMAEAGGRGCHLNSIDFGDLAVHILGRLSKYATGTQPASL